MRFPALGSFRRRSLLPVLRFAFFFRGSSEVLPREFVHAPRPSVHRLLLSLSFRQTSTVLHVFLRATCAFSRVLHRGSCHVLSHGRDRGPRCGWNAPGNLSCLQRSPGAAWSEPRTPSRRVDASRNARCGMEWRALPRVGHEEETDPPSSNETVLETRNGPGEGAKGGWWKNTVVRGGGFQHQGSVVPFLRG